MWAYKLTLDFVFKLMSVVLKAKKIVRMSPGEWRHRAKEYLDIQQERKNYQTELTEVTADDFNFFASGFEDFWRQFGRKDAREFIQSQSAKRLFPTPQNSQKGMLFQLLYPHEFIRSIDRADGFLAGKFKFMGIECEFPDSIPWQSDPLSLQEYPTGFYRDIEIFKNREGQDIKHVWEINRLQFLIEIAKAYYLTDDEKYRVKLEALILDWVEKNPFKTGVNWTSALEVGMRAFSLIWVLNFYFASRKQSAEVFFTILKLLYLSGVYIKENLSFYFSPYNHLIGEVAALFMIGYQFPILKNANDWHKEAWNILDDQVEKQFSADGGTVEQATFYHHFTLGFYLQCANAKKLNGDPISQRILNQCERSIEFSMQMMRPDKTLPWIGDIDTARSIYFSDPANWNFTSFQGIGAVWFNRSEMKAAAGKLGEDAYWFLSPSEIEAYNAMPEQHLEHNFYTLGSSGYTVMRSGWQPDSHFSYIDCGPIAEGIFKDGTPSAAHGHADLLHFEIAAFGENLLIDPGFSNYRGDIAWHKYFRSTEAHNTITIDGQSQLEQAGILSWSHAPEFFPLQRFSGDFCNAFVGEHHGFKRLPAKAVHRRYFLFIDNKFWVTFDILQSGLRKENRAKHAVKAHFHTVDYAEIQLSSKDPNSIIILGEKASLQMHFLTRNNEEISGATERGGDTPEKGWISPTYRERRPAQIATLSTSCDFPFEMIGLYLPEKLGAPSQIKIRKKQHGFSVSTSDSDYKIEFTSSENNDEKSGSTTGVKITRLAEKMEQSLMLQSIPEQDRKNGYPTAPIIKI
ncbi:MAG: hypothetical protein DWQ05_20940 [Calditrichaeota bacterium]|nr:MAG: hypothetical protein DWQ05_20940 [Calditrichota bacterium]